MNDLPEPKNPEVNGNKGVSRRTFTKVLLGGVAATTVIGKAADWWFNNSRGTRDLADLVGIHQYKLVVDNPTQFPYSFSPWTKYVEFESAMIDEFNLPEKDFPRIKKYIMHVGDEISDKVARRILATKNTYDIADVIREFPRDKLMIMMAEEIAKKGIFYSPESLLTNSFNSDLHEDKNAAHLDCDLLSYLMCHIGRRLDVPIYVVQGPYHLYLWVPTSDEKGYVIEPTEFREDVRDFDTRTGKSEMKYVGVSPGFFSDWERQKQHGGIIADERFQKAAKLHVPMKNEQFIVDDIIGNIVPAIIEYADEKNDLDLKLKAHSKTLDLVIHGTESYIVANNVFNSTLQFAREVIYSSQGNPEKERALGTARWLVEGGLSIRERYSQIITSEEPFDKILLGWLYCNDGEVKRGLAVLDEMREYYRKRTSYGEFFGDRSEPRAQNSYHALLLIYIAITHIKN